MIDNADRGTDRNTSAKTQGLTLSTRDRTGTHRAFLQASPSLLHISCNSAACRILPHIVCRIFHAILLPHLRCISVEDAILESGEAAANVHCAAVIRSVAEKYAVFEPRVSCGLESLVTYRHMFLNL